MTEKTDKVGALLLAAGGSSRMGLAKQLLVYEGKTLLRRAAETLLASTCSPIIVVLGAEFEQIEKQIEDLSVEMAHNANWRTGMGSSIKAGLVRLLQIEPDASALIITLCDQPNITASHIDQLTKKFRETGNGIVAAEYSGTTGVPALFSRRYFDELLKIDGDQGARKLIRSASGDLSTVQIPEAAFDIDTPEDLVSQKS
ncbi:MAG TPA: nucleotidyltransferase family protein [Pyrinomonadaceae bacterium]|nr:nucleotidyltransferase family protein [Pyrinomonadaceae bacterium]